MLCIVFMLSYVFVWLQLQKSAEFSIGLDLTVALDRDALQQVHDGRETRISHEVPSYSLFSSLFVIHEDTPIQ